jgi:hypothetical protein
MLSVCIIQETRFIDYAATYKRKDIFAVSTTHFNFGMITSLGRARCTGTQRHPRPPIALRSPGPYEVSHQDNIEDLVSYEWMPTCISPVF